MFLELLNYEIEGAAYNADRSQVLDGAYLTVSVRRRAETEGDGPDGPETPLRIALASLSSKDKASLLAAYSTIESLVAGHAVTEYSEKAASPQALDEKIAEARAADKRLDALNAQISAKEAALAADSAVAAKVAPS